MSLLLRPCSYVFAPLRPCSYVFAPTSLLLYVLVPTSFSLTSEGGGSFGICDLEFVIWNLIAWVIEIGLWLR